MNAQKELLGSGRANVNTAVSNSSNDDRTRLLFPHRSWKSSGRRRCRLVLMMSLKASALSNNEVLGSHPHGCDQSGAQLPVNLFHGPERQI